MPQELIKAKVTSGAATTLALGPWAFCSQSPDALTHPDQLPNAKISWLPAVVPGTVAAALQQAGQWDLGQPLDVDSQDWWFRTSFPRPDLLPGQRCFLDCAGLATLAEVWLNGRAILSSVNMFRAFQVDVTPHLQGQNDLVIVFRSLMKFLNQPRPRPRWKTNLVNHQQIRWCRTTLLGRIPGWSPPVPPVGPWRGLRLTVADISISQLRLNSTVEGSMGIVTLHGRLQSTVPIRQAILKIGDTEFPLEVHHGENHWEVQGKAQIINPPLWWPHTHGKQPLLICSLALATSAINTIVIPCGKIGFRHIEVKQSGGFSVQVNGKPVYCRGACWTISNMVTLDGSPDSLARDLRLARTAGVNMLRVCGPMIYESDAFYDLCDQLGILVWQDFMFANMDYPVDDPAFVAEITEEAIYQLSRLAPHPSVAIYCGNSEVEQQAAMLGMPRELWRNHWFAKRLPDLCWEYHPGTAYVPSTPCGGTLPFHVGTGITHYYGVGAYLQETGEVRKADVKFTAECLGFANVPESDTVNLVAGGGPVMVHHPRWKQRVPRDTGAGWDFDDVRDHYLQRFFGVDPVRLRSFDTDRYLRLSRVVTGEVMAQVFAEWRSSHSRNRGALVWFFKDLWPGAGWGIVDSLGVPKAAYYFLKRSWQNLYLGMTDEGLDGLHVHVANETEDDFSGWVELLLLKDDHIVVAHKEIACALPPQSLQTFEADALLDGFYDVAYVYRFGPPKHDLAIATLYDRQRGVVSEAFHFVQQREPAMVKGVNLEIEGEDCGEGRFRLRLKADRFLRNVSFDARGFLPSDNYFHLVPGREKIVELVSLQNPVPKFKAFMEALNLRDPVRIPLKKPQVQS